MDWDFYDHCSKTAKNYESNYSESIFIEYMKKVFSEKISFIQPQEII